jgi:outer membrane cobalamin receptor
MVLRVEELLVQFKCYSSFYRIEVLRDGASAQYGSDAIAGVINIKKKQLTNLTLHYLAVHFSKDK